MECCVAGSCWAAGVALVTTVLLRRRPPEVEEPKADSKTDWLQTAAQNGDVIKESAPLVQCSHQDASLRVTVSGLRKVLADGSFLYVSRPGGKVEELVLLSGADIKVEGAVVTVSTKLRCLLTLWLDSDSEALAWAEKLIRHSALGTNSHHPPAPAEAAEAAGHGGAPAAREDAQTAGERQPEPSNGHHQGSESEAEARHRARIAELEKRVNANLKEAVQRARRIKELEGVAKDSDETREHQQHVRDWEKRAVAARTQAEAKERDVAEMEQKTQEAREVAKAKADEIEKLQMELARQSSEAQKSLQAAPAEALDGVLGRVENLLDNSSKEMVIDASSVSKLRASTEKVKKSMPATDTRVTELMEGMASALRWPTALRERLAAAEKAVKDHKQLQDETSKQLDFLKAQFDKERADRERAEERAEELSKDLASAQQAASEAAEKVRNLQESTRRETDELKRQLEMAQKVAEQTAGQLEEAQARATGAAKSRVEEVEAQKREAEEAARELERQLEAAEQAAASAIADVHQLQEESEKEVEDLQKELAALHEQASNAQEPTAEQIKTLEHQLEEEERGEQEASDKAAKLQEQLDAAQEAAQRAAAEMAELGAAFEASHIDFPDAGTGGQAQELEDVLSSAEAALAAMGIDVDSMGSKPKPEDS